MCSFLYSSLVKAIHAKVSADNSVYVSESEFVRFILNCSLMCGNEGSNKSFLHLLFKSVLVSIILLNAGFLHRGSQLVIYSSISYSLYHGIICEVAEQVASLPVILLSNTMHIHLGRYCKLKI